MIIHSEYKAHRSFFMTYSPTVCFLDTTYRENISTKYYQSVPVQVFKLLIITEVLPQILERLKNCMKRVCCTSLFQSYSHHWLNLVNVISKSCKLIL